MIISHETVHVLTPHCQTEHKNETAVMALAYQEQVLTLLFKGEYKDVHCAYLYWYTRIFAVRSWLAHHGISPVQTEQLLQ